MIFSKFSKKNFAKISFGNRNYAKFSIGEAAKNLSNNFKKINDKIPWKEIIGTRDKIIHHYFGVNLDMIWDIIKNDLPKLKKELKRIKNSKV